MTHLKNQSGAVLAVSLIFLLLLTIIGITSLRTTSLQERMAGNTRDQYLAFQAAEGAIREAELGLEAGDFNIDSFDNDGTDGLYNDTAAFQDLHDLVAWDTAGGSYIESDQLDGNDELTIPPKFVIQFLGVVSSTPQGPIVRGAGRRDRGNLSRLFRIIARGTGGAGEADGTGTSIVFLQTVFGVPLS